LVEPRLQGLEAVRAEPIEAASRVICECVDVHEPGLTQHAKVSAERGTGHLDVVRQIAGPTGPTSQRVDYSTARRVGQGGQRRVQIINDNVNY